MSSDNHRPTDPAGDYVRESRRRPVKHVIVNVAVIALLVVLRAAGVLFSGLFNVAATVADSPALRWLFVTVREGSIKLHARDIQASAVADAELWPTDSRFIKSTASCATPPSVGSLGRWRSGSIRKLRASKGMT
jgi:hypothetical protein